MDRLRLILAGCGLAVIITAPGCRSMRSEVPPARPYGPNGQQVPPVGFGSDPRPVPNNALGATMNDGPRSTGQLGTPAPGASNNYGKGVLTWEDQTVGYLDPDLIRQAVQRVIG